MRSCCSGQASRGEVAGLGVIQNWYLNLDCNAKYKEVFGVLVLRDKFQIESCCGGSM